MEPELYYTAAMQMLAPLRVTVRKVRKVRKTTNSRSQWGWLFLATLILGACSGQALLPEPEVVASSGAVACAAPEATAAGLEMLGQGGNAVDAAVAVALALAVVHPPAGNLGGGGFAVVRFSGKVETLDFREIAPAAATHDMYLDDQGQLDPERSQVGPLAAGVPGSPVGLFELHKKLGELPWPQVVAPAIRLAEEGFSVSARLARSLERCRDLLSRFPETTAVWFADGEPLRAGAKVTIPALAATLRAYAEAGPTAITEGPAAAAIARTSARHGGVITADDLAAYRAVWRDPVRFEAAGWQVASMALPSSGGIILGQTCGILQQLGWSSQGPGVERTHLLVETWRRAFADRYLLGDPESSLANPEDLLDPAWIERRAEAISTQSATSSAEVGPWPEGTPLEHPETTHISVVDGKGNVVSLTTTLNGAFGCGLLVPEVGILLNNEMDDFAAAPGQPNMFGLIQGEANAVAPGHRMLSSMSPTVAWRDGEVIALGSPGGSHIPTATVQVLLNLIIDGDSLQAAVDRPRIHHQWLPDTIRAEADALTPETQAELRQRGHQIEPIDHLGEVHAVRLHPSGKTEAAADPRGPGAAGVVGPAP